MQNSFNSEELALLTRVIDQACADLGGCDGAARASMSQRIFLYAVDGELDYQKLLAAAKSKKEPEALAG